MSRFSVSLPECHTGHRRLRRSLGTPLFRAWSSPARAKRQLSAVGNVPVAGLALILGIDRFMSEARALTNLIGNGVATVVVGKWCGELDVQRMKKVLNKETDADAEEPEKVIDAVEEHMPVKPA